MGNLLNRSRSIFRISYFLQSTQFFLLKWHGCVRWDGIYLQVRGLQQALNKACQQGGVVIDSIAGTTLMQDPHSPLATTLKPTTTPAIITTIATATITTTTGRRSMMEPSPIPPTPTSTWSVSPQALSPSLSPSIASVKLTPQLPLNPSSSSLCPSTSALSLTMAQKTTLQQQSENMFGDMTFPAQQLHSNQCESSNSSNSSNNSALSSNNFNNMNSMNNYNRGSFSPDGASTQSSGHMEIQEDPDLHAARVLADIFVHQRDLQHDHNLFQDNLPSPKHPRLLLDAMRHATTNNNSNNNTALQINGNSNDHHPQKNHTMTSWL
eukprot:c8201_g1_i2.p1 GENE.c8201_g1_i2~~c8201_g1_i2.p1  ORF type:complete len:323 (+),score=63.63 c8201_g1_i2:312-1280(+)